MAADCSCSCSSNVVDAAVRADRDLSVRRLGSLTSSDAAADAVQEQAQQSLVLADLPHELHLTLATLVDGVGLAGLEMTSSHWRKLLSQPKSNMWREALRARSLLNTTQTFPRSRTLRAAPGAAAKWKKRYVTTYCREHGICPSCFERSEPGEVGTVCLKKLFSRMRLDSPRRVTQPLPESADGNGIGNGNGNGRRTVANCTLDA